jgi:alpha-1,6-mannosyltransferase
LAHVPLGVNLDIFRPRDGDGPPDPVRTVLYVGRLSEEKELGVLFDAFAALAARRRDVRLVVAGEGPLRPFAGRFAAGRTDVALEGLRPYGPELARLYGGADVLALPGRNETFGLAVLEGLACGLPVVAIGRGGPLDLITPEVGALARPGDAGDLAGKIDDVLARRPDPRACRRKAESMSWDRTFRRLLEVYAEAGAGPAPVAGREAAARLPEVAPADGAVPLTTGISWT